MALYSMSLPRNGGVEILPGNQQLAQHYGRFLGTYCKHLDVMENIILDFGMTTPRIPHTGRCVQSCSLLCCSSLLPVSALQNLCYVVFSEDFSSIRVLDDELGVIQDSILLSAC
jgi:hypothetical protein